MGVSVAEKVFKVYGEAQPNCFGIPVRHEVGPGSCHAVMAWLASISPTLDRWLRSGVLNRFRRSNDD
jgi:hypothetical protein